MLYNLVVGVRSLIIRSPVTLAACIGVSTLAFKVKTGLSAFKYKDAYTYNLESTIEILLKNRNQLVYLFEVGEEKTDVVHLILLVCSLMNEKLLEPVLLSW